MVSRNNKILFGSSLILLPFGCYALPARSQAVQPTQSTQSAIDEPSTIVSPASSLGLTPAKASQLNQALAAHDYITGEKLLLDEIQLEPHSLRTARLLAFVGNIYFLNQDYLGAAVAWKKSEAITPLDPPLRFSLAMAYIRMGHSDWARTVLVSLATQQPKEALYPYWVGRLDYDAHQYADAIQHFQQAITLAPGMSRAYDNLGLCYFYRNENALAIENYKKAIELDKTSEHPSAWPYLNLAETLQFTGKAEEAEPNLREAIRLDPTLATAHYRLGGVLGDLNHLQAAVTELLEAIHLDDKYPEPHLALAHTYNLLGQKDAAKKETEAYLRLHADAKVTQQPTSKP